MLGELAKLLFEKGSQSFAEDMVLARKMAALRGEPHWSDQLPANVDVAQVNKALQAFGDALLDKKPPAQANLDQRIAKILTTFFVNRLRSIRDSAAARQEQARRLEEMRGQRDLKQLRALDPLAFEYWTAAYFKRFGFKDIVVTAFSADFGVDVSMTTPGGKKAIVQCKRYGRNNPIGRPTVQQTYGVMKLLEADVCYVATTGRFTPPAMELNKRRDISLLDGDFLVSGKRPPGSR